MSSRDCNSCGNLLRRDGTSQKQRFFEELGTDYVKIDERSIVDLLHFTMKYSEKVQFWDSFNRRSGDWLAMLENRQASVYAEIANVDIDTLKSDFETVYNTAGTAPGDEVQLVDMIKQTLALAELLDKWLNLIDSELDLYDVLENAIQRQAASLVNDLIAYDMGGFIHFGIAPNATSTASDGEADYTALSDLWQIDLSAIIPNEDIFDTDANLKRHFYVVFISLIGVLEKMKTEAAAKFEDDLGDYAKHEPHFALFLAFLKLYEYAQDHINTLTEKHLNFYYREILQLSEKAARPDGVHIIFEPAKNVDQKLVEEGTELTAGKDELGTKIVFTTDEEIVVNKASISSLKALYLDRNVDSKYIQTIYSAEVANSLDGKGLAFTDENNAWEPFGKRQVSNGGLIAQPTMDLARVGFAIASPELKLKDGTRVVKIKLGIDSTSFETVFGDSSTTEFGTFGNYVNDNDSTVDVSVYADRLAACKTRLTEWLSLRITGAEEWLTPDNLDLTSLEPVALEANFITFNFSISRAQGQVIPYSSKIHGQNYTTEWPVLEILCDQQIKYVDSDFTPVAYEFFKDLKITSVKIDCEVTEMTNLVVGNDTGSLDVSKPYPPFTTLPQVGSNFYIGSQEVFSKRLTSLAVELDWKGVPDSEFSDYYAHYKWVEICDTMCYLPARIVQDNAHFKAQLKFLSDFEWKKLSDNSTSTQMYQSSTLALKQTRSVMTLPLFWLMSILNGLGTKAAKAVGNESQLDAIDLDKIIYSWEDSSPLGDITTYNYVNLFRNNSNKGSDDNDARLPHTIEVENTSTSNNFGLLGASYARDPYLEEVTEYAEGVKRGFVKLELINDFFHAAYGRILTERLNKKADDEPLSTPNTPYTPELYKISLNYTSTYEWDYVDATWEDRVDQFFHITPFGEVEVFPSADEKALEEESQEVYYSKALVPSLFKLGEPIDATGRTELKLDIDTGRVVEIKLEETSEGKLYIGIANLVPPQSLSLLFQFKEGTEDSDLELPSVQWSYLSNNQWVVFENSDIVSDTTNGLINSGIIKFAMPSDATNNNVIYGSDLHWLRADVLGNTEAFSDLIAVHAQAVRASYAESETNDPNRLETPIAEGEISKFLNKDYEIKSIAQPYASFDGRVMEQSTHFYTRVAERLRHKQRGITVRDYEHLVLEEFPEIYKVKCINHTSKYSEFAPGNVSVVVIPYFKNQNERDPFELKVSKAKLNKIRQFLVRLNSPFVNLDVRNPKYETIRVQFTVEFHIGYDRTYYEAKLNEEIKEYISPWAFGKDEEIIFGGKINRSLILNFIEEREYVDYVTDFTMHHKEDENRAEVETFIAVGTTASSVLVTALDHTIFGLES